MDGVENLYHGGSRSLQDRFDTRRIADRLEEKTVRDTIDDDDRAFIEARDMFFIATADAEENRNVRTMNFSDSAFITGESAEN